MVSISDNDLKILEFLIRNYAARHTTREIGLKLKISPAGSYKSLKKLEKDNIVIPERLGTGLFYNINYRKPAAFYLACFTMSIREINIGELRQHAAAIIRSKGTITIISHHHDEKVIRESAKKLFGETVPELLDEEEFGKRIATKDPKTMEMMEEAEFLHGTEVIIRAISRMIR